MELLCWRMDCACVCACKLDVWVWVRAKCDAQQLRQNMMKFHWKTMKYTSMQHVLCDRTCKL